MPKTPVRVPLVGEDGNVFSIIGRVRKALRKAGYASEAEQYTKEVQQTKSYDEALRKTLEYIVEGREEDD